MKKIIYIVLFLFFTNCSINKVVLHHGVHNLEKKQLKLKVNSSNNVFRGYLNADDLIRWLIKILISSSTKCNIYNVGSDETISIKNLADIIAKKFNKSVLTNNKNSNKGDFDFYVPSIFKAKKELNLKIKFKIKKSINQLLKF